MHGHGCCETFQVLAPVDIIVMSCEFAATWLAGVIQTHRLDRVKWLMCSGGALISALPYLSEQHGCQIHCPKTSIPRGL